MAALDDPVPPTWQHASQHSRFGCRLVLDQNVDSPVLFERGVSQTRAIPGTPLRQRPAPQTAVAPVSMSCPVTIGSPEQIFESVAPTLAAAGRVPVPTFAFSSRSYRFRNSQHAQGAILAESARTRTF